MKDSRTFPLVLNLAVLFVTILYLSFGSLAYLFFGEDTSDNLIGDNLTGVAADVLRICLSYVLIVAYPLQMFPVVKICEKYLFGESEITIGDTIKRNSFRVLVVCITVVATMVGWPMCDSCRLEYQDPGNRRFHAEPTACWDCGPEMPN